MGALTAPKVSKGLTAGAVASMGAVVGAGAIIGAVGTCTGDCIGVVADAGAPKEAVCSRGETAELISGV